MNTIKTIIPPTNGALANMAAKIEGGDLGGIPDFLKVENRPKTAAVAIPKPVPAQSAIKAPPVALAPKAAVVVKASPKKPTSEAPKPEKTSIKNTKAKAAPKKKAASELPSTSRAARTSKTEVVGRLLQRKEGCTTAEILAETKWPAVSVPQLAKANHLKLRKEKVKGQPTRYFGS